MTILCKTCGTSYDDSDEIIAHCKVCEDERQFVPASGQAWITPEVLTATHSNKWQQHEENLLSIKTVPAFAINQRAFLLRTPHGNVLWDCIASLDAATELLINALGGLRAIAISHPHYYTTMQDWAETFSAPVWLHTSDREWIMRDSTAIRLWEGDSMELLPSVRLLRLGGHFAGGTVLHWTEGDGVLLAGDILQVTPGKDAVSFMWSYPNMLPLPTTTIENIMHRLADVNFERLYGAFEGQNMTKQAHDAVMRSGQKYIDCLKQERA
ncbi:beta-lactamase-like protein [Trabulsiella guamensis ATCC 49490]|uniref:Beta-lactamase-like protein n=1 Tax=Trabulsiella guamensis ATCC 49490 TaxID=1005994 RepID=A0A085AM46_9ENTR|nr:MBL fold metallo-hydrolase [Trabulsiella guamensis]KFC11291.1 beta-lactamase-like protein [Trabulsiella guamensis ATCC 49490]